MSAGRIGRSAVAVAVVAVALTGCETTQDQSARLQRQAAAVQQPDQIKLGRAEPEVRVLGHQELRAKDRSAIVVELENRGDRPLRRVPVGLRAVAGGKQQYSNQMAGSDALLLRVPLLPPRTRLTWVNAEVPELADGATVEVQLGAAARRRPGTAPRLRIAGLRRDGGEPSPDGVAVSGTVHNDGRVAQSDVPVYIVARDGSRVVAAATSRIDELAAGASEPFQASLVGDGRRGRLEAVALPTKLQSARSSR